MAERFGSQTHPSGGQRFGSQTYVALSGSHVGDMAAVEPAADVFAAASLPRVTGNVVAVEPGADVLAADGLSSHSYTMQAIESPIPDTFTASGAAQAIVTGSFRFGSATHPSGGLRFGSQVWGGLGPSGALAASEAGSDAVAAAGFLAGLSYGFQIYDVLASFVDYSSESLGAAITGTLEDGYKVMLPVLGAGIAFTWERNEFGNPSLRLANLTGAIALSAVPWYVWDGGAWSAALFDVSSTTQGAAFLIEFGADTFAGNGSQTRYGSVQLVESQGPDSFGAFGIVPVRGSLALVEVGSDALAADGSVHYIGTAALVEIGADALAVSASLIVTTDIALAELAAPDVFAATGSKSAQGDLAATETGADTLAASGRLSSAGALAATEAATADTLAGAAVVLVSGAGALLEVGADVLAATGSAARDGALAALEVGADVFAAAAVVAVAGDLDAVDAPDVFAAVGVRESQGEVIAAELDALEGGSDRFVSRGYVGDHDPIITFDGPLDVNAATHGFSILSRRTNEAA